jgi:hypothetical protein
MAFIIFCAFIDSKTGLKISSGPVIHEVSSHPTRSREPEPEDLKGHIAVRYWDMASLTLEEILPPAHSPSFELRSGHWSAVREPSFVIMITDNATHIDILLSTCH